VPLCHPGLTLGATHAPPTTDYCGADSSKSFQYDAAAQACVLCPAGTWRDYADASTSACKDCPAGTYSAEGDAECTACPVGEVSGDLAQPATSFGSAAWWFGVPSQAGELWQERHAVTGSAPIEQCACPAVPFALTRRLLLLQRALSCLSMSA